MNNIETIKSKLRSFIGTKKIKATPMTWGSIANSVEFLSLKTETPDSHRKRLGIWSNILIPNIAMILDLTDMFRGHLRRCLKNEVSRNPDDQGFYTSHGRFVDRREAYKIAFEAGQITEKFDRLLISEDLY